MQKCDYFRREGRKALKIVIYWISFKLLNVPILCSVHIRKGDCFSMINSLVSRRMRLYVKQWNQRNVIQNMSKNVKLLPRKDVQQNMNYSVQQVSFSTFKHTVRNPNLWQKDVEIMTKHGKFTNYCLLWYNLDTFWYMQCLKEISSIQKNNNELSTLS